MSLILCLAYLVGVWLLGYAVLSALLGPGKRQWAQVAGMSFAAGVGIVGMVLFSMSLAGIVPNRATLSALGSIAIVGCVIMGLSRRLIRPAWSSDLGQLDIRTVIAMGAAALLCGVFALAILADLTPGLWHVDTFATWMFKAKVIASEPLRPIPRAMTDPMLSYSHQDYPLGFPFAVAGVYAVIGSEDLQLGKALMIALYAALIAVIYSTLRTMLRRADSVILTAMFAAAPVIVENASLPVAELLLVLNLACAASMLLQWMRSGGRGEFTACAIFAAFAAFSKNEGLALMPVIAIVALTWVAVYRQRKLLIDWCSGAALGLTLVMPWLIYRTKLPHTYENYGGRFSQFSQLTGGLARLPAILPQFLGGTFHFNRAGLFWPLLALCAGFGWRAFRQPVAILFWLLLIMHLSVYVAAFMVTPWDPNVLIRMVSPRLLMHAMPVATILIGLHFRECSRLPMDTA